MLQLDATDKFQVNPETGIGTIDDLSDSRALQWFAVNLMLHKLQAPEWKLKETAMLFDVAEHDLNITLALPPYPANSGSKVRHLGELAKRVVATRKLSAFGHPVELVTLNFPGLGLYAARLHVYTLPSSINNTIEAEKEILATTSNDIFKETKKRPTVYNVRNACVNPITDAYWQWNNDLFRVRGLVNGKHEMVKERNGPFAGKRINRPVADYNYCHNIMADYIAQKLNRGTRSQLQALVRNRPLFMEGLLKEKCVERGLSLPDMGGNVSGKALLNSLRHACKIPNTEQPFACTDLTFLVTLIDSVIGLKENSVVWSSKQIKGMTAEWPLGAAFYIYENGL